MSNSKSSVKPSQTMNVFLGKEEQKKATNMSLKEQADERRRLLEEDKKKKELEEQKELEEMQKQIELEESQKKQELEEQQAEQEKNNAEQQLAVTSEGNDENSTSSDSSSSPVVVDEPKKSVPTPPVEEEIMQKGRRKKVRVMDTHDSRTHPIHKTLIECLDSISLWGDRYKIVNTGIIHMLLSTKELSEELKTVNPDLFEKLKSLQKEYRL